MCRDATTHLGLRIIKIPPSPSEPTSMDSILKRIIGFAMLVVVIWIFGGCHDENINSADQIVGSGRIAVRSMSFPSFSGIKLTGFGEVYVTQDTLSSVRLEVDDNVIDRVSVSVQDGNLVVGLPKGSYSNVTLKLHVSMKSVEYLEVSGAGSFATVGPIEVDVLTCRIVGAGEMTMSGHAATENLSLDGAGSYRGFNLESSACTVNLSGAGSAEVNVTHHLEASISGVGSVVYAGNPSEIVSHVSGMGSIQRK